jgi:hypothetical protein
MHRVIEVDPAGRSVVTRGDANPRSDPPVEVADILGHLDGLYDEAMGAAGSLPRFRRLWDDVMRRLVAARRFGLRFDTALARGTALFGKVCGRLRRQMRGELR